MHGLIRENDGTFEGFIDRLLRGQFGASTAVIHALCEGEFFTIIIPRRRIKSVSDEVLKARTAQALRAFLCLSLSETIRLNPVNWYTFRYTLYRGPLCIPILEGIQTWRASHAPSLTTKSLKPNLGKKTSPFMMVTACSCSSKPPVSFRYQRSVSGSRTNLSLGSYPALTLAAARQIRDQYLATLAQGMDPQQQQEQGQGQGQGQASEQRQIELDSIFSTVAANWFKMKSKSVTEDYAKDIWRSLDKDVFPAIGAIPVQEIKARTIVEALEPIKARGALETVRRLVQRINEIMIYAVNTGLIDANPTSGVGMAFEKPKKQNMPTLRPEELPKLMRSMVMSNLSVATRCLIEWQLLTLVRPAEASGARWVEIDLDA